MVSSNPRIPAQNRLRSEFAPRNLAGLAWTLAALKAGGWPLGGQLRLRFGPKQQVEGFVNCSTGHWLRGPVVEFFFLYFFW